MSTTAPQQIRPVIECLCQILSFNGFSTVTPEIFRLAKFDRNEATIPLWRLIYEILHFDPTKSTQQHSTDKFSQIPKDQMVDTIKNILFTCGYTYEKLLSLDNQMNKGSRQLLICLGWLVYQKKIIEQCTEKCLKSDSILDYDDTSPLYQVDASEYVEHCVQEKDLLGQIKQAMRLNSKLRFSLRRLHGLVIENTNLQHQIHNCHNMSSLEVYLCQHPNLLSHYMIELEDEHRKLNLFLFWIEHENTFWKWMESVLDQAIAEEPDQDTDDDEDGYKSLRDVDYRRLEGEKQKFNAAIDTIDSALLRVKQLWISTNNHDSIENDVSSIIASIDTQVSSLFNELLSTNASITPVPQLDPSLFLHQPHRLVYSKHSDSNNINNANTNNPNSNSIKPMHFEHETKCLDELQNDIDQNVEQQRAILDTLSHEFENAMIV